VAVVVGVSHCPCRPGVSLAIPVLVCRFSMASTYLLGCAIIQPGGVGIVRFFRQADRPGESRLVAAVVAAAAVAAVVLAGDSALPRLSGMPIPAAVEDALTHPGPAGVVASGKIENASWQLVFRPSLRIAGRRARSDDDEPSGACFSPSDCRRRSRRQRSGKGLVNAC
jgi:hypothetical protein